MIHWNFTALQDLYTVRQFEFHPRKEIIAFGTISGELCNVNLDTRAVKYVGHVGKTRKDKIIAICWNRCTESNLVSESDELVFTGTEMGRICVTNCAPEDPVIQRFEDFGDYTCCTHVSMDNNQLIVSGFTKSASIYDVTTGQVHRKLENIHNDNLNNCRFANTSPHICYTSSYDGTLKKWDLRSSEPTPIYTITSPSKIITININRADDRIVVAGEKKEINLYAAIDGHHLHRQAIPRSFARTNYAQDPLALLFEQEEESLFSRAFFSASNEYIYSVNCGNRIDSHVYVTSVATGELLNTIYIPPVRADPALAQQQPADMYMPLTLRGHPRHDEEFAVLAISTASRYQHLIYAKPKLLSSSTTSVTSTTTPAADTTLPPLQLQQSLPPLTTIPQCTTWEEKLQDWSHTVQDRKNELIERQQMTYDQLLNESLCLVCQVEKKCMALVPCGHVCMCRGCCNMVIYHTTGGSTCPLCNVLIQSTMRVFV